MEVFDLRTLVGELWSEDFGQMFLVRGLWSEDCGQRTLVRGLWTEDFGHTCSLLLLDSGWQRLTCHCRFEVMKRLFFAKKKGR